MFRRLRQLGRTIRRHTPLISTIDALIIELADSNGECCRQMIKAKRAQDSESNAIMEAVKVHKLLAAKQDEAMREFERANQAEGRFKNCTATVIRLEEEAQELFNDCTELRSQRDAFKSELDKISDQAERNAREAEQYSQDAEILAQKIDDVCADRAELQKQFDAATNGWIAAQNEGVRLMRLVNEHKRHISMMASSIKGITDHYSGHYGDYRQSSPESAN